jgi:ribonuclease Z
MLTIVYLGTGAAVPVPGRDNTCLALDDGEEITLIDTSGSPLKRLAEADLQPERLARVIITHEHPDHTCGLPSLLQTLWLTGRTDPLPIFSLPATWPVLDRLIAAYWPDGWRRGFALEKRQLTGEDRPFLDTPRLSLRTALGQHSVPCVAVRAESADGVVVYSADTSPADSVVDLARGAGLLAHESTFAAGAEALAGQLGHSTARQAAEVASRAGVARLALVHFSPTGDAGLDRVRADAAAAFSGPIDVPGDGDRFSLG